MRRRRSMETTQKLQSRLTLKWKNRYIIFFIYVETISFLSFELGLRS